MPIVRLSDFHPATGTAITLGTFDGLHLGHQVLLEHTTHLARVNTLQSLAFAFIQPPQNYVGTPKPLIMPVEHKLAALEKLVDFVIAVEFPEIGWMEAKAFVQDVLLNQLKATIVIVGPDARFGKNRRGDCTFLQKLGTTLDFSVQVVPRVTVRGRSVSSTAVRESLLAGHVEEARALLGYTPKLFGTVVRGNGRGRELGYPTANLALGENVLVPAAGVYAVRVTVKNSMRDGVLYIGQRSTFADAGPSVEVHLFKTEEQLYDLELEVRMLRRLRGDQHFNTVEMLKVQIEADIQAALMALQSQIA